MNLAQIFIETIDLLAAGERCSTTPGCGGRWRCRRPPAAARCTGPCSGAAAPLLTPC